MFGFFNIVDSDLVFLVNWDWVREVCECISFFFLGVDIIVFVWIVDVEVFE